MTKACVKAFARQVRSRLTILVRKKGGELSISVDGQLILETTDPNPLGGGYFGFRTFRTELWWSDLEVWAL